MTAKTLFDKIWGDHVVEILNDDQYLIYIDRHILHEVSSPQAFSGLDIHGRIVRKNNLTFATSDHIVSTDRKRTSTDQHAEALISALQSNTKKHNITHFDINNVNQGIVHVIAPELAIALPGTTIVCGDSHTCTLGGVGSLAWGIGTSEVEHVLATQTLRMTKPKTFKIKIEGTPLPYVYAKDIILYIIGKLGSKAGQGYAIEYTGSYVKQLAIEQRLTLCNLSIELGARIGLIAPDEKTIDYIKGKLYAPNSDSWDEAAHYWKTLYSDDHAIFSKTAEFDISHVKPQISWGTSPEQVINIDEKIPDPEDYIDLNKKVSLKHSLAYMGLASNQSLIGEKVDVVFIGSCTNGRLSDLKEAAKLIKGKYIAKNIRALVVPGSMQVKKEAEKEGLDKIFIDAGFEWRMPGCSMCVSINNDKVKPGERCVSTSNRNFEGRQGPGSRTHLASPAVAAASAIKGYICHPEDIQS